MARKGENIRKRQDGRWEGRYQVTVNGLRRTKSVYAHSYKEVKQKLCEQKAREQQNQFQVSIHYTELKRSLTLNEIATEWFETLPRQVKHSTYVKYENIYAKHIKPYFGDELIETLSNDYINQASRHCKLFDNKHNYA